eukprot:7865408-Pyramimonas_sp.AAC.1
MNSGIHKWNRAVFRMSAFGHANAKPTVLYANKECTWIQKFVKEAALRRKPRDRQGPQTWPRPSASPEGVQDIRAPEAPRIRGPGRACV